MDPHFPFDLVTIASSAGGVDALSRVVSALPAEFPAAVLAVHHLCRDRSSGLAAILGRCTPMPVRFASDGDPIVRGTITLAPPDRHLVVAPKGGLRLTCTERQNYSRPSADPLMISAAFHYGRRLLSVILTGANRDGASGAWAVSYAGGMVIVQDAETSAFPEMPQAAVDLGAAQYVLPLDTIGAAITALVCRPGVEQFFRRAAG